jgi:hypothetical protein
MAKVTKTIKFEVEEETYQKFVGLAKIKGIKVSTLIGSMVNSFVGREWGRLK